MTDSIAKPYSAIPAVRHRLITGAARDLRADVLGFFTRNAHELGDLYRFRFLFAKCVVLNHPDLIQEMLTTRAGETIKSHDTRKLSMAMGNGLLTSEGEFWKNQRRTIQPMFHNQRIRGYGSIMVDETVRAMAGWRDGQVRDIHAEMNGLTLRIVASSLFGVDISEHIGRIGSTLDELMRRFEQGMATWALGPLHWLVPNTWATFRAARRLDEVVWSMIAQHRSRTGEGADLLSLLLFARDEQGRAMSDKQVRDEILTLLLAGHETTAIALAWTVCLLAQHPMVERRLTAEVDAVLGDRSATAEDMGRLVYTQQVVKESMRLYPPAWGIGREVVSPTTVGGYRLPKYTQVFIAPYATHRDGRFFPDPERFDPDRFSAEREKKISNFLYMPFAAGPRHCIGRGFAMMEAVLVLATMVRRYRFDLVPGQRIELQPAVTLRPRYGIQVVLRARDAGGGGAKGESRDRSAELAEART